MSMMLERKEDLSLRQLIETSLPSTIAINVVDGFPEEVLTLPTIAIDAVTIELVEFQLGDRDGRRVRRWDIDIFAKNKSQRDEIGYILLHALKNGIMVYNYDEGFPPTVSPSEESHLDVVSRKMTIVKIFSSLVEKMYYRATISIVAMNDVI